MIYEIHVTSEPSGESREVREEGRPGESRSQILARVLRRNAFDGFEFTEVVMVPVSPEAALAEARDRIEALRSDLAALREVNDTLTGVIECHRLNKHLGPDEIRRVLAAVVMAKPATFPKGFRADHSAYGLGAFCAPEDIDGEVVALVEDALEREPDGP